MTSESHAAEQGSQEALTGVTGPALGRAAAELGGARGTQTSEPGVSGRPASGEARRANVEVLLPSSSCYKPLEKLQPALRKEASLA